MTSFNFIFFSISNDFGAFHRRQEIEEIANNIGEGKVIYCLPPMFFIRKLCSISNKNNKKSKKSKVRVCNLYTLIPMSLALKVKTLMFLFVTLPVMLQVFYIKKFNLPSIRTIMWFYKPNQYLYLKHLKPYIYLHYDNYKNDNNYSFSKDKKFDETLDLCIKKSLLTLVCSANLYCKFKVKYPKNIHYYPNAISRSLLRSRPLELGNKNKKVIGFIGQLDDSFDSFLLEKIAIRFPHYKIRLIGEIKQKNIFVIEAKYSNVELLGYVPYESLSSKMDVFSIGICPYKKSAFNKFRNPLKIYEYFSAGLPVVSMDCDIDKIVKSMTALASGHESFIQLLQQELATDNKYKAEQRRYFTANNCWDNRVCFVLSTINKCI